MRSYEEAPRLINRTCPMCKEWSVYSEQKGLPQGYKRWACRHCDHVVGVYFGHDFSGADISQSKDLRPTLMREEGCFIATAAFGDPMALELGVLRRFRDTVLLKGRIGSMMVPIYYKLSPPIAERIKDSQHICRFTRLLFRPVLKACRVLISAEKRAVRSTPSETQQ